MHRSPMMRKNVFLTPLQNKLYIKEIGSLYHAGCFFFDDIPYLSFILLMCVKKNLVNRLYF